MRDIYLLHARVEFPAFRGVSTFTQRGIYPLTDPDEGRGAREVGTPLIPRGCVGVHVVGVGHAWPSGMHGGHLLHDSEGKSCDATATQCIC